MLLTIVTRIHLTCDGLKIFRSTEKANWYDMNYITRSKFVFMLFQEMYSCVHMTGCHYFDSFYLCVRPFAHDMM